MDTAGIRRLSQGSIQDRLKAISILIELPSCNNEELELLKALANLSQPEEVRLKSVDILANRSIRWRTYHELAEMLKHDPSEVVREKTRIVLTKADMEYWKSRHTKETKKKWFTKIRLNNVTSRLKRRGLQIIAVLLATAISVFVLITNVSLQPSTYDSLVQTNASLFCFVVALPFALAQLSRYKVSLGSFLSVSNIVFFLLQIINIFLPIFVRDSAYSRIIVALSIICFALTLPYLITIREMLVTSSIVERTAESAVAGLRMADHRPLLELELMAYQAVESKDYGAFAAILQSFSRVVLPISMDLPVSDIWDTIKAGEYAPIASLERIGAQLTTSIPLSIFCQEVLSIHSLKNFVVKKDETTWKNIEFKLLKSLLTNREIEERSKEIILPYVVKWGIANLYDDSDYELRAITEVATSLLPYGNLALDLLDSFLERLRPRFPMWQDEYTLPLSILFPVRQNGLKMISRIELMIAKTKLSRKMEKHDSSKTLEISEANADDLFDFLFIQKASYGEEAEQVGDFLIVPLMETRELLAKQLKNQHVFKAIQDGKAVGFIRCEYNKSRARITLFSVYPDLEKQIWNEILKQFESLNPSISEYETVVYGNSQKRHVFENLGYQLWKTEELSEDISMSYLRKGMSGSQIPVREADREVARALC